MVYVDLGMELVLCFERQLEHLYRKYVEDKMDIARLDDLCNKIVVECFHLHANIYNELGLNILNILNNHLEFYLSRL